MMLILSIKPVNLRKITFVLTFSSCDYVFFDLCFVFCCFTECPNITMEALNGTQCDNDTITLQGPSTVAFRCTYEIDQYSMTSYAWYRDDQLLAGMNSKIAYIDIGRGSHQVKCTAVIDINTILPGRNFNNPACICNEMRAVDVIVVGT